MSSLNEHQSTILVVDDNPTNLQVLLDALEGEGFERLVALDGEMAIEQARYAKPDLILLDVMMPGIDGFETCRQLKADPDLQSIPVIFMTALTETKQKLLGFEAGGVDYVSKPLQHQEVIARINTHLTISQLQQALKQSNHALTLSEQRYALALNGARDGIWDWDLCSQQIYVSPRWWQILGFEQASQTITDQDWYLRIHGDDVDEFKSLLAQHLAGERDHFEFEYRIQNQSGEYLWVLTRGSAVNGLPEEGASAEPEQLETTEVKPQRIAGSQTDITAGKLIDNLTGLPNRLMFVDRLNRLIEKAKLAQQPATESAFLTVMVIDIDRFKNVNDSLGFKVGNKLLAALGERLLETLQQLKNAQYSAQRFLLAKLDADRYALLIHNVGDDEQIAPIAKQLSDSIKKSITIEKHVIYPSISIGAVWCKTAADSANDIINRAETALHSAKSNGFGSFALFNQTMLGQVKQRLQLEADLWKAIEQQQFVLFYQPIVSIQSGEITGCEALVRWIHPQLGLVPPDQFIPLAEEIEAILPIGEWVIREACRQQKSWCELGYNHIKVAINVSVRQFQQQDIPALVEKILTETGVSPEAIKLEITESIAIQDIELTVKTLKRLYDMGVKISMDDFGTGYSSLSYLARLAINFLKIDKAFIDELDQQLDQPELVTPILAMAKSLNLKVIAEGVENKQQLAFLRQLKCEELQGYFFNKPVPANEFTELLKSGRKLDS